MRVEFGVLGEVCARVDDRPIDLGPARQRCVLAVLLTQPNRPITLDRLADRVWAEDRPLRQEATLHTYLSRLRARLPAEAGAGIERGPGGYLLRAGEDAVDLHRFRVLTARARTAGDRDAAELYERALALWRGEPFAGLDAPWLLSYRHRLEAELLSVRLDHTDVALRLGRHAGLPATLEALAAEHPLNERVAGQLVRALYRDGRQADALMRYEGFRARLANELGTDPSPDLRLLHRQMLTESVELPAPPAAPAPAAVPVPRQLPAAPPSFTGRAADLTELDGARGRIVVITGPGGVGKTWLALRWAHDNVSRFPDGQLYANLRGFDPSGTPLLPETAVYGFLTALGVAPSAVPAGLDAQVALFRSLVADKRTLVVLDNARDTAQVAPLLPGGPGCAVLVTSRNRLAGLVAGHDARAVTLDAFDAATARRVLARALGEKRTRAEPDAVAELLDRCAGLPLALGIVGARARAHPGFALADLAKELREEESPLEALDAGEPTASLRAVFSCSYRALSPPAGRLFRLLGLHPGPDLSARAAAALAGVPLPEVKRLLAELAAVHLVSEHRPGRFTLHDLLWAYAAERAEPEERDTAVPRVLDHYLRTANAAALRLYPHRDPIDLPEPWPESAPEDIRDARRAVAWFTAEHQVLLSAIRTADLPAYVWRLAWALVTYLDRQGRWDDLRVAHERSLDAAGGVPLGRAHGHAGLAIACTRLGRHDDALAHFQRALDGFVELGDRVGQARTHQHLSWVCGVLGRAQEALAHLRRALCLYEAEDHRCGVAIARGAMGWNNIAAGDYHEAVAQCERALSLYEELDHVYGQAGTWDSLGYAHHKLGDHARAITCYENVLALLGPEHDARYERSQTLSRLGDTHLAAGDAETARRYWRQALEILDEVHPADAAGVRRKLEVSAPGRTAPPRS